MSQIIKNKNKSVSVLATATGKLEKVGMRFGNADERNVNISEKQMSQEKL